MGGRVNTCGQKPLGMAARVVRHDDGHHFENLETCGSVWVCPICAGKIAARRKVEIAKVLAGHAAAGGRAYMVTLTMPHHRFQACGTLRVAIAAAWRKVKQGNRWQRARERFGWLGDIRALEVTHGEYGWHPHLHVLVLFEPGTTAITAEAFGAWLFEVWAVAIAGLGFGRCSPEAFRFEPVTDSGAGDYVAKWGITDELTGSQGKSARGGRTPWQLLANAADGDDAAAALFRHYGKAMKGARQLTWSRALRERYGFTPELNDKVAAADTPEARPVAEIHRTIFTALVRHELENDLLEAADDAGVKGIANFLQQHIGLVFAVKLIPDRASGVVPLFYIPGETPIP